MTTEDERVTVAERYARATQSSDLSPTVDQRTDADVLLAAGLATVWTDKDGKVDQAKRERYSLALSIYRLGVVGDHTSLWRIVDECDGWMAGHLARKGRRPMPKSARRQLIVTVLNWYEHPKCDYCSGTGTVIEEDAGRSIGATCPACHGSTKKSLEREVPRAYIQTAQWLADQIEQHAILIHKEMAKLLSQRMEL